MRKGVVYWVLPQSIFSSYWLVIIWQNWLAGKKTQCNRQTNLLISTQKMSHKQVTYSNSPIYKKHAHPPQVRCHIWEGQFLIIVPGFECWWFEHFMYLQWAFEKSFFVFGREVVHSNVVSIVDWVFRLHVTSLQIRLSPCFWSISTCLMLASLG